MRRWVAVLLGSAGCAGCLGGETPSPGEDAATVVRDGGIGAARDVLGVELLGHGTALPPAVERAPAALAPDAGTGDASDMRVRVTLRARVVTRPCPVPSGTYCDGFAAVTEEGHAVAVDTYSYLGPRPSCRAQWSEGTGVDALVGIWQQRRSATGELSVLALASCAGFNAASPAGEPDGGVPAEASHDVRTLHAAWGPALRVTVEGVVVARWSSSAGAFGFVLQDPDGAPRSGVRVFRGKDSTVPGPAPQVGDRVRVTARTGAGSPRQLEL